MFCSSYIHMYFILTRTMEMLHETDTVFFSPLHTVYKCFLQLIESKKTERKGTISCPIVLFLCHFGGFTWFANTVK
jgi:hypothetical protein